MGPCAAILPWLPVPLSVYFLFRFVPPCRAVLLLLALLSHEGGHFAAFFLFGAGVPRIRPVSGGFRIASRAKSAYASCVATGLSACLGLQTLLNVGGVVKAIPLTGIPLPLLSHGGSSLVATLVTVGLLLAVSDEAPPPGRAPRAAAAPGGGDDVFA